MLLKSKWVSHSQTTLACYYMGILSIRHVTCYPDLSANKLNNRNKKKKERSQSYCMGHCFYKPLHTWSTIYTNFLYKLQHVKKYISNLVKNMVKFKFKLKQKKLNSTIHFITIFINYIVHKIFNFLRFNSSMQCSCER